MKIPAVVWPAPGAVAVTETEVADANPGKVVVEAELTMISPGTERAWWLGLAKTASRFSPATGSHFVGRVIGMAVEVDGLAEGDRVAAAAGGWASRGVAAGHPSAAGGAGGRGLCPPYGLGQRAPRRITSVETIGTSRFACLFQQ